MTSLVLASNGGAWVLGLIAITVVIFLIFIFWLLSRYRRCAPDRILVKFGQVGPDQTMDCIHGGGTFIWPVVQDYAYLSLAPMTINISLKDILSSQIVNNNMLGTFTVAISTDKELMTHAAERLLRLDSQEIEEIAKQIIIGPLSATMTSLSIEQINQDRKSVLDTIRNSVEPELKKIGLYLINVNVQKNACVFNDSKVGIK